MPELLSSTAAFAPPAVPVVWRRHSFGEPVRELRPAGQSLAEIVRSLPDLPTRFWEDGVITVGEQPVPREMWARVRPKPAADGSIDVSLWLAPQGSVLKIVATIALIAAVSFISGPAGAAFFTSLGLSATAAGLVAAGAAAGVGILGSLAINALSPPPSTAAIDSSTLKSDAQKQLTPASLQGNQLQPGATLPHVRGTRKIFPPILVKPFVDLQGDDEVITAVIGLGGAHAISDVRSDGTPLDDIEEVTHEVREGHTSDTIVSLATVQSKTDANQIELSSHDIDPDHTDRLANQADPTQSIPHWHAMRARGAPDEIRVNLRWPQGLFDQDNPGTDIIVPVRTRIREVGTSTWTNLPQVFFSFRKQQTFQKDIRLIFQQAPVLPTPPTSNGPTQAHIAVPMRVETVIGDASGVAVEGFNGDASDSVFWSAVTTGYYGADFGGGAERSVTYAILSPPTGPGGFTDQATITFKLRAKNTAPASPSDGTLLATSGSIADTTGRVLLISSDAVSAWRYIWIEWITSASATTDIGDVRLVGDNDYGWLASNYFWSSLGGALHMDAANISTTGARRIALHPDSARIYLDPATFPKGDYDIEILRGCTDQQTNFSHDFYNLAVPGSTYSDHFRWNVSGGFAKLARDAGGVYDKIVRQRLQFIWYEHPIPNAPGKMALIAIQAVNRQLGQVSCIASLYVNDWDGVGWNTLTTTSNPAPHVRDILLGPLNADPVPADLIDDAGLVAWRTHNIAQAYEINAVIESQSADVAAQLCAACGYARMRQSETFGVILDMDRSLESPVQTFTARNSRGYQWQSSKVRFPSGFRVIYNEITDDYAETELIVLDPDGDQGGRYEEVRYDGFVTEAEVQARALFDMKQARLRMTFHSFETNQQAIKCKRGDLIGLNHPTLALEMGAAYIREILTDGAGNVTGFRLDGSVPTSGSDGVFSGPDDCIVDLYSDGVFAFVDLGIVVRLEDGSELAAQIDPFGGGLELDTRTVILATPEALPSGLAEGCLVSTGILGSERLRLIVGNIAPKAGNQFPHQITAVDEAPALWGA